MLDQKVLFLKSNQIRNCLNWFFHFFSQPAKTLWYDRKKYVTINFMVQNPKDVQVDIQDTKIILR